MNRRLKILATTGAAVAVAATGGVAIAGAGGDDDNEKPDTAITGSALGKASDAALAHTGGGRVSGTEAGDEEGAYEVEVTRRDPPWRGAGSSQVDVHLDRDFKVIDSARDEEGDSD